MATIKTRISRKVVTPKKLHVQSGLSARDYLKRLDEAESDVRRGRVLGPFNTAKQAMKALHSRPR